jgi:hypothetical protein
MTQLENKSEVAESNLLEGLNKADPKFDPKFDAVNALFFKEDLDDFKGKVASMEKSKKEVDRILEKVQKLSALEGQLKEGSEYRAELEEKVNLLSKYSESMQKKIDRYNSIIEDIDA